MWFSVAMDAIRRGFQEMPADTAATLPFSLPDFEKANSEHDGVFSQRDLETLLASKKLSDAERQKIIDFTLKIPISKEELGEFLENPSVSTSHKKFVKAADKNKSGDLDFAEVSRLAESRYNKFGPFKPYIAIFFKRMVRTNHNTFRDFFYWGILQPTFQGGFSVKHPDGSTLNIGEIIITEPAYIYFEIVGGQRYRGFTIGLDPFKIIYSLIDGGVEEECMIDKKYSPFFIRLYFEMERIGLGEIAEIIKNHGAPCTPPAQENSH